MNVSSSVKSSRMPLRGWSHMVWWGALISHLPSCAPRLQTPQGLQRRCFSAKHRASTSSEEPGRWGWVGGWVGSP